MRARRSIIVTAVVVAAGAALASTATSGGRRLAEITCGAEISTDLTLQRDLICPGDGIIVNSDSPVTVNLNGHTLRGSGAGGGISFIGSSGGTVKNGTVRGFAGGIGTSNGSLNISHVAIIRNRFRGISIFEANLSISDSTVSDNGDIGVAADGSGFSTTVQRTTFARNGGDGLAFGLGMVWSVTESRFLGNGGDGLSSDDASASVTNSVASHNRGDGIHIVVTDTFNPTPGVTYPVSNNTTDGNGTWGIEYDLFWITEPIDLGLNIARNNGQAGQCFNIVCQTSP